MIGIGTCVSLTESGVSYIQEMFDDFSYDGEIYEVVGVDDDDELYEIDINGHRFWMKNEEIIE